MRYRHDPEGLRLPIKLDNATNGEFMPRPMGRRQRQMIDLAHADAGEHARRAGLGRRAFMISACGAATVLAVLNRAASAAERTGGYFVLETEAALDPDAAAATLAGEEFVFDVQNHAINPDGAWRRRPNAAQLIAGLRTTTAAARYSHEPLAGELAYLNALDGDHYVKDVFLDSDTQMAVMSVLSTLHEDEPLPIDEAAGIRALVDRLGGGRRLLLHGKVLPNIPGDISRMRELKRAWGVSAWKLYTQLAHGPTRGYRLDDEALMTPLIEESRALGVDVVCAHKGLAFGSGERAFSTCADVGRAARLYPDIKFIIYHGGYDRDTIEGPYHPGRAEAGVNSLVKSLIDHGVAPNSNVYAELGAAWRAMIPEPEQAAHAWGKLLKHVGEDNVLWGTDCCWYGSPQDQIQAFRAFQIAEPLRERYGYPELTRELKAKIFGLNAARAYEVDVPGKRAALEGDAVARLRDEYGGQPDPSFLTYGPKSRQAFLALRSGRDA
jgi:predicted TIM-barrel fold metal-dependent hydrolase